MRKEWTRFPFLLPFLYRVHRRNVCIIGEGGSAATVDQPTSRPTDRRMDGTDIKNGADKSRKGNVRRQQCGVPLLPVDRYLQPYRVSDERWLAGNSSSRLFFHLDIHPTSPKSNGNEMARFVFSSFPLTGFFLHPPLTPDF